MANAMSTLSDEDFKRVETALSRVGIAADMFPSHTVDAIEQASLKYETATHEADKDHYADIVSTLAAILLA